MMSDRLPPYVTRDIVHDRLQRIFPEGIENRLYCTRELAASTVFAGLYIGAVEGNEQCLAPMHVYRMTDVQAANASDSARRRYPELLRRRKHKPEGSRWYADNTREPIRDETIREGLLAVGALVEKPGIPTTSSRPRYQLKADFAALFDPTLTGPALDNEIKEYQRSHLSASALARVVISQEAATASYQRVLVTFPNQITRWLAPGPSSVITKAVVEVFAQRFLGNPVVLWLSESGNKVVHQDNQIANRIGLHIEAQKNLPGLILADLAPEEPLIVFVEVVATDGAVTRLRQTALLEMTDNASFARSQVAFVTAYQDRQSPGFKKTVTNLAWGSFAWFASEPDAILEMRGGHLATAPLSQLL